ncbi:ribonuclease P protein component [Lacinutrix neustonica]|uniref:Ribonuclease P protein component n=1 Tax=Lacinutrix neustonica TaxID=2980107 RepID=A0A9E8MTD1_9FLAO|nr:ribonuclease P protein component [Lacinutrix neustonica]WAC00986.1 ribonuclease P protein component [Lacinutrix neustonica]
MKFTYNKKEKLKSQKAIAQLFLEGHSLSAYPLRLVYQQNETGIKAGVSVSKRNFKKAVDRIRIKRLLREAYRLNKNMLIDNNSTHYSFMILYISKEMPDFILVDTKMKSLLHKFIDQTSKNLKS